MRQKKLQRLLLRLVIANLVLLALDTFMLLALLVRPPGTTEVVYTPAATATTTAPGAATGPARAAASSAAPTGTPAAVGTAPPESSLIVGEAADPIAAFFQVTLEPVERAARDHGLDPAEFRPDPSLVEQAVASGSLESEPSRAVIEQLEAAYERFNMPFPENAIPEAPAEAPPAEGGEAPGGASGGGSPAASTAGSTVQAPEAGGAAPPGAQATGGGSSDQHEILQAYFNITLSRIRAQGTSPDTLPTDEEVRAAVASGDITSEASRAVLDKLRAAYEAAGMSFPEPAVMP